MKAHL
jgi:hypothetical protein